MIILMNKKGFSAIQIILIVLLIIGVLGVYYLKNNKTTSSINLDTENAASSSSQMYGLPNYAPFNLSETWEGGLNTYTNPKMNISLKYPKSFSKTEEEEMPTYEGSAIFAVRLLTPQAPKWELGKEDFDWTSYDKNQMSVYIEVFNNSNNLSIEDFIKNKFNDIGIDGKTSTYVTLKKGLKETSSPKENSYVYEGILGENPIKKVMFAQKDKVYNLTLVGGTDTGAGYSDDAEQVFDRIISSIEFL